MTPSYRQLLHDTLREAGERWPDKAAVVADDGSATHGELLDSALRLAAGLQGLGVRRGDRVLIFMENTRACATAIYGTLLAGGVMVVVNAQTKADRVAHIARDSTPTVVLAEGSLVPVAAHALDELPERLPLVAANATGELPAGAIAFDELLSGSASPAGHAAIASDLAALVYTSGTTGIPKGVMLTHGGMLFAVDSIVEYLGLEHDDRILSVLNMSFTYGMSQLLMTERIGMTLHLERSFAFPAKTLQHLVSSEATVIPAVPTVYATLISMHGDGGRSYPSVRCLTNAAAALPPAMHEPLRAIFPNARLYRMYGQTECIRVCYLDPDLVDAKPTSVGTAMPGTEAIVLDEEGRPVAPGEVGTLHVRGPHVTPGYWNSPTLTADLLHEGGYLGDRLMNTHDLFMTDDDGCLYFVARSDEIIKTRGEKVSPAEVDAALFELPQVKEAAVVGVPDDVLGEAIRAYVVLEEGVEMTERDVIRACRERLPLFAVPRDVVFVDELPKTPSGKVRRKSLAS